MDYDDGWLTACKDCMKREHCTQDCGQVGCTCRTLCDSCRARILRVVDSVKLLRAEQIDIDLLSDEVNA